MFTPMTRATAQIIAYRLNRAYGSEFASPLPLSSDPLRWGILCRIPSRLAGTPLEWLEEHFIEDEAFFRTVPGLAEVLRLPR